VARKRKATRTRRTGRVVAKTGGLTLTEVARLDDLRRQLQKRSRGTAPMRWNADPDDVQKSVAQLVLTLVEFLRQLLERQSIRRMDDGTLTEQQIEDIGRALMKLEETVRDIGRKFGISPEELNLDLGPIGTLM
jgi:hypothetical protein